MPEILHSSISMKSIHIYVLIFTHCKSVMTQVKFGGRVSNMNYLQGLALYESVRSSMGGQATREVTVSNSVEDSRFFFPL